LFFFGKINFGKNTEMDYSTLKALHVIFMVSWFAGLFYWARLFIYHREAQDKSSEEKRILSAQFELMEKRVWAIIVVPASIGTLLFGLWLLFQNPYLIKQPWMHIKLTFVLLLFIYQFKCLAMMQAMKSGVFNWKSQQLRLWNEVSTLVLVAVVFLAFTKGTMSWWKGTLGFFAFAVLLMVLVKMYKKRRNKKGL
jgi:putative membrane protein